MKKAFFVLLFLSLVGAGALFWLIRSAPPEVGDHAEAGKDGLHIVEGHEGGEGHGEEHGEHAEGGEHGKETVVADENGEAEGGHGEHGEKAAAAHGKAEGEGASPRLSIRTDPTGAKVWIDGKESGVTPIDLELKENSQMVQIEAEGYEDFTRVAPSSGEAGDGELNWKVQMKKADGKKVRAADRVVEAPVSKPAAHGEEHGEAEHEAPKAKKPGKGIFAKKEDAPAAKHESHEAPAKSESHAAPAKAESHAAAEPEESAHGEAAEGHGDVKSEKEILASGPSDEERGPMPKDAFKSGKVGPYVVQLKSVERVKGWDDSVRRLVGRYRDDMAAVLQKDGLFGCPVALKGKGQWVRLMVGPFTSKAVAAERLAELRKFVPDAYVAGSQACQK